MVLDFEQLEKELRSLPGWQHFDGSIQKGFQFDTFAGSLEFVNNVARLAEQINHHPDIDIRYSKVILTLSTRSEDGVTEKDISLARQIERLVR